MNLQPFGPDPQLQISDAERSALHELRQATHLSATQRRQVEIVAGLAFGEPGSRIAKRLGLRHSTISNVLASIRRKGIGCFLKKWKAKAPPVQKDRPSHTAGQKGTNSLAGWLVDVDPGIGGVADVLCWRIAKGQMTIIFGVSDPDSPISEPAVRDNGKLFEAFCHHLSSAAGEEYPWSTWNLFDVQICAAMGIGLEGACRTSSDGTIGLPNLARKEGNLAGSGISVCALCSGSYGLETLASFGGGVTWKIGRNAWMFADCAQLINHLKVALGRIRDAWNGTGLLPWLPVLLEALGAWEDAGLAGPFLWTLEVENMLRLARRRRIHRNYHAAIGGVFELDARMRSALPWQGEFVLRSVQLRPRVEVVPNPENAAEEIIALHVLPQLGLKLRGRTLGKDRAEQARLYRRNIKCTSKSVKFRYSNRDHERQLGARMLVPMFEGPSPTRDDFDSSSPCVLIPRHWLGPESERTADIDALDWNQIPEGPSETALSGESRPMPCLLFHAPIILEGIRDAVQRNWYGYFLNQMYQQQAEFVKNLNSQNPEGFANEVFGFIRFKPSPFHWNLDEDATLARSTKETAGWKLWEEYLLEAGNEGLLTNVQENVFVPIEVSLVNVLQDLDADLLLLGIKKSVREKIDQFEEQWSFLIRKIIATEYDLATPGGKGRVIGAIDSSLRSEAKNRWAEIESIFQDALISFGNGARRISRYVIENIQRQVIAKERPQAFFVETKASLLARWKAFLGLHIRGQIFSDIREIVHEDLERFGGLTDDLDDSDVSQILDLVQALLQNPGNTVAAGEFVEFANDIDFGVWVTAIEEIPTRKYAADIRAAITQAYQESRLEQSLPSKQEKLRAIFEKASKQMS